MPCRWKAVPGTAPPYGRKSGVSRVGLSRMAWRLIHEAAQAASPADSHAERTDGGPRLPNHNPATIPTTQSGFIRENAQSLIHGPGDRHRAVQPYDETDLRRAFQFRPSS